jgi:hypothetical protein
MHGPSSVSSASSQVVGFSRSGALGPLLGPGGEHVAVAGALVHAAARPRGHAVALLAAEAAGPHARAPRARAGAAAPHAALARAEPCGDACRHARTRSGEGTAGGRSITPAGRPPNSR